MLGLLYREGELDSQEVITGYDHDFSQQYFEKKVDRFIFIFDSFFFILLCEWRNLILQGGESVLSGLPVFKRSYISIKSFISVLLLDLLSEGEVFAAPPEIRDVNITLEGRRVFRR